MHRNPFFYLRSADSHLVCYLRKVGRLTDSSRKQAKEELKGNRCSSAVSATSLYILFDQIALRNPVNRSRSFLTSGCTSLNFFVRNSRRSQSYSISK